MTHDPLCGMYLSCSVCGNGSTKCTCRLIARVREDERAAALRDAGQAIPHAAFCLAHGMSNANDLDCDCGRTDAVAAIRALKGEQ